MTDPPPEVDRIREAYRRRHEVDLGSVGSYVVNERKETIQRIVAAHFGDYLSAMRICDVGCGAGGDLAAWRDAGVPEARLAGTELLEVPLASARALLSEADLRLVNGFTLPWEAHSFDLTWGSMTFSSIKDAANRRQLFDEMWRVTRPGGVVALYDFRIRKPTNPDVVAMTRKRIAALGPSAQQRYSVTPFLPLLPLVLRLPGLVRTGMLRLLPRTHAIWVWERDQETHNTT